MTTPLVKPTTIVEPFANTGSKNTIPVTPGTIPGRASLDLGFPPLTMTPVSQGGYPPSGLDFNGILNWITQHTTWTNGGGQYTFDTSMSAFIGGYPIGTVLQSNDGSASYVSIVANNTADFNADPSQIGLTWAPYAGAAVSPYGSTSIATTGGATSLTGVQAARNTIVVSGVLTSNATLTFPSTSRKWIVINKTTGAFTLTCKAATGTGVTVTQGKTDSIVFDGTNMVYANADVPTQATGDNSLAAASTAFVQGAVVGQIKTANFAANATGDYKVDTSGGAFTMTLPDPPAAWSYIRVRDVSAYCSVNPLTINAGTKTILGSSSPLVFDVAGESLDLWYNGSDWRLI